MQRIVGQVQIVMGVRACDNVAMDSSIARFPAGFEILMQIAAVTEGGGDAPLDLAPTMPLISDPTLNPTFSQSGGIGNSRGVVCSRRMGQPLGFGEYSSRSWPGDCRTFSLVPSFHHTTFSSSPTDRRYL